MNPSPIDLQQMLTAAAGAGDPQARTFLPIFRSFTAHLGPDPSDPATARITCGDKQIRSAVSKAPEGCPKAAS